MPSRSHRTTLPTAPDPAWLGAEALPSGLVRINDEIATALSVQSQKAITTDGICSPLGLIAISRRWMNKTPRMN